MGIIARLNLWMILMTTFFAYHIVYGWMSIVLLIVNVYLFAKIVYDWGYEDGKHEGSDFK